MFRRIFIPCLIILIMPSLTYAQKKADDVILNRLKHHITFLINDTTPDNSQNDLKQVEYIEQQIKSIGLLPRGDNNSYRQKFVVDEGKTYKQGTSLSINGKNLDPGTGFIPLGFSASESATGSPLIAVQERNQPWIMDLNNHLDNQVQDSGASFSALLYQLAQQAIKEQATAVLFYNSADPTNITFNQQTTHDTLPIPVVYIKQAIAHQFFEDPTSSVHIDLKVQISERKVSAYNLIGYIDHKAPATMIFQADTPDDAATLIELARFLKNDDRHYRNQNYLFLYFPGGKMNLPGIKYFVNNPTIDLQKMDCIIYLNDTRQLDPQTLRLLVSGVDSLPLWEAVVRKVKIKGLDVQVDQNKNKNYDQPFLDQKDIPIWSFSSGITQHTSTKKSEEINYKDELKLIRYLTEIVRGWNRK